MQLTRILLPTFALAFATGAFGDNLTICGSSPAAGQHSTPFVCGVGANIMTGTATEVIIDSWFDHIIVTGITATGAGVADPHNTHPAFDGAGILTASFGGTVAGLPFSLGGESFRNDTHANNFTGIDAIATWSGPPANTLMPLGVSGFDLQNGIYETSTTLSGVLTWNVPAGETMFFPTSVDLVAQVPEPFSAGLILIGACMMLAGGGWRRISNMGRRA